MSVQTKLVFLGHTTNKLYIFGTVHTNLPGTSQEFGISTNALNIVVVVLCNVCNSVFLPSHRNYCSQWKNCMLAGANMFTNGKLDNSFLSYVCAKLTFQNWVWKEKLPQQKGYWMVPSNLKVLAKFGLCSNCLQKFDECSLARALKIFATARMLKFSLKFPPK